MFVRPLTNELQERAENELNEKPDRVKEDLEHIKEWFEKQSHIKLRTDDQWLLNFLRGCKFSLQRTKEKLDFFYTMRSLVPELFDNRDPLSPEIQEILNTGVILPLPKTQDPTSPRIILVRWGICDPEKMHYVNLSKTFFMVMDILMNEDDNATVAGIKGLLDLKGFSSQYLLQCTPTILKKVALCIENAYPIRVKRMDAIYSPSFFQIIYNIMTPFFSKKLKSRICLYSEEHYTDVYEQFPQKFLPKEYGGENGTVDEITSTWKKKFESYREWFLEDSKYRTFEELRLGQPKTTADVFGVEGTFRKLAVD